MIGRGSFSDLQLVETIPSQFLTFQTRGIDFPYFDEKLVLALEDFINQTEGSRSNASSNVFYVANESILFSLCCMTR